MTSSTDRGSELAAQARDLLAAHHEGPPLLLPNAWDASSARAVEDAGFRFVATSSHAVADVLAETDDDSTKPDLVFDWLARITRSVTVPVTADLEAGHGLPAAELIDRMIAAGVIGCNLEDTDHHGPDTLVDAERQAAYLADARAAADAVGVHVVLNARVDTFVRRLGDADAQRAEAIRRGRLYLDAGADCVYPIGMQRVDDVAAIVDALPGPVNAMARRGALSAEQLAAHGVRRISLGSGLFQITQERLREMLARFAGGADLEEL